MCAQMNAVLLIAFLFQMNLADGSWNHRSVSMRLKMRFTSSLLRVA
jgi:hypothetical protein